MRKAPPRSINWWAMYALSMNGAYRRALDRSVTKQSAVHSAMEMAWYDWPEAIKRYVLPATPAEPRVPRPR